MKKNTKDATMKYILGSAVLALVLLSGCGENKEEQKKVQEKIEPVQQQTVIKKAANDLKVTTVKMIDKGAKLAEDISSGSQEIAKEVVAQTKEMSEVAMKKVKEIKKDLNSTMEEVVVASQKETVSPVDAKQLFIKCSGCHGQKAEKKALNTSKVIQGWDKDKIVNAIKGYKEGTYGGAMKTVMAGQVSTLSEKEIEALASYISNMKP